MPAPETDYLEAILNANVYDVAIETPLQEAPLLSERLGNRLFLKREDLQPVFSFKLRGRLQQDVAPARPPSCGAASSPRRPATTPRASRSRRSDSAPRRRS